MQNFDHNIGFWEKRQFFRQKLSKSQKIVIITSTLGVDFFRRDQWYVFCYTMQRNKY
jgi:hypothetical protein